MPDLRLKEAHLPELRLPEMSRDDITRALRGARDVDLSRFDPRRIDLPDVHLPDVDLSKVELPELPKVELPKVELPRVELPKLDLGKTDVSKPVVSAAQAAGIAKRPSRLPLAIGLLITLALIAFALAASPVFRSKLETMGRRARERRARRWGEQEIAVKEPVAFDAAETAPVQPSALAASAPTNGSPFDGPSELPEGLGTDRPEPSTV